MCCYPSNRRARYSWRSAAAAWRTVGSVQGFVELAALEASAVDPNSRSSTRLSLVPVPQILG